MPRRAGRSGFIAGTGALITLIAAAAGTPAQALTVCVTGPISVQVAVTVPRTTPPDLVVGRPVAVAPTPLGTSPQTSQRATSAPTPTLLDVWAFPSVFLPPPVLQGANVVPMAPSNIVIAPQIVVCPVPVVVGSTPLASAIADPPGAVVAPKGPPAPAGGVLSAAIAGRVPEDTVADLAQAPARYDRLVVSVTGIVTAPRAGTTPGGQPYVVFGLGEGAAAITSVAWGTPVLREGAAVRVIGTFYTAAPFDLGAWTSRRSVLDAALVVVLGRR